MVLAMMQPIHTKIVACIRYDPEFQNSSLLIMFQFAATKDATRAKPHST